MSLDGLDWPGEPCRSLGRAGSPVHTGMCTGMAASHTGLVGGCLGEDALLVLYTPALLVDSGDSRHARVVCLSGGEQPEPQLG